MYNLNSNHVKKHHEKIENHIEEKFNFQIYGIKNAINIIINNHIYYHLLIE